MRPIVTARPTRAVVAVAALLVLAGCGSDDATGGSGSGSDDRSVVLARLSSEVKNTAGAMEVYYVDHATYAASTGLLDLPVSTAATVRVVSADATGYRLCAVDAVSGAWAGLDSSDGVVHRGGSGGACPAG